VTGISFVVFVWLTTRAVIFGALLWSAPAHAPSALTNWDGIWYEHVATVGYEYVPDGRQHDVAFFPLYPLSVAALMRVAPIPFAAAAAVVNNVAFFFALLVIYDWLRRICDVTVARWCVAALCVFPTTLFTVVAYSEGLFLLCSAASLRAFDRGAYVTAALTAALGSATRLFGALLFPAFALDALLRRRGAGALWCSACALAGPLAYGLYCATRFGDPLAYVHVQGAWRAGLGFSFPDWEYVIAYGITWMWPYQLAIVLVGTWWLRRRAFLAPPAASVVAFALGVAELAVWGKERLTFLLVFFGGGLVIRYRDRLGVAATTYALCGIGLILFSGRPYSAERLAYSIVPIAGALALFWKSFPAFGFAALAVTAVDAPLYAIRFARGIFVD
jgi:hypothetical protein